MFYLEQVDNTILFAPQADVFNTSPNSAVIDITPFQKVAVSLQTGAGGTGRGRLQLFAGAASNGAGATAIPYKARVNNSATLLDVEATGYTTEAAVNQVVVLEPSTEAIGKYGNFLHLKLTETVDAPVFGSATLHGYAKRYSS
jgi:hypothetical protein